MHIKPYNAIAIRLAKRSFSCTMLVLVQDTFGNMLRNAQNLDKQNSTLHPGQATILLQQKCQVLTLTTVSLRQFQS